MNRTVERFQEAIRGTLPGYLGVEVMDVSPGEARGRLKIRPEHLHPGGFVHSAATACLADSVAAWATVALLDETQGFSTIEFKTNFFTAVASGVLIAEARALHSGKRTVVLESRVVDHESNLIALMVVTQAVLEAPARED
jgi:uncharacterized protein (TIGR00369 family)